MAGKPPSAGGGKATTVAKPASVVNEKALLTKTTAAIVRELDKVDNRNGRFFSVPVTEEVAPKYFSVVDRAKAMDLGTIKAKLKTYATIDEFVTDVTNMCNNAFLYNAEGTVVRGVAEVRALLCGYPQRPPLANCSSVCVVHPAQSHPVCRRCRPPLFAQQLLSTFESMYKAAYPPAAAAATAAPAAAVPPSLPPVPTMLRPSSAALSLPAAVASTTVRCQAHCTCAWRLWQHSVGRPSLHPCAQPRVSPPPPTPITTAPTPTTRTPGWRSAGLPPTRCTVDGRARVY